MRFYQSPIKSPAAASLSFLLGLVTIGAIVLSLRVGDNNRLSESTETKTETLPIDPTLSDIQQYIHANREQALRGNTHAPEKTVTETRPIKTTTVVPAPKASTPAPTKKKSDRTTRTS